MMGRQGKVGVGAAVAALAALLCHHLGQAFFVKAPIAGLGERGAVSLQRQGRRPGRGYGSSGTVRTRWVDALRRQRLSFCGRCWWW